LPKDLPNPPTYRKINTAEPAGAGLLPSIPTTMPIYKVDDFAYTVLAQKISSVSGVGQVTIAGQARDFAVRIRADPAALASYGISMEDIRQAIATATVNQAKGTLEGEVPVLHPRRQRPALPGSGLPRPDRGLPQRARRSGSANIAEVVDGARLPRTGAWYNGKRAENPAGVPPARRQHDADRRSGQGDACRSFWAGLPPSLQVDLVSDRSLEIEASIADVKFTLVLAIGLVGDGHPALPAALLGDRHPLDRPLPLSLIATFAVM